MGVSIKEIYSPILGYGWEDLPSDYIKRRYLPVEDGIVTTPSGANLGTAFLANGDLRLINTSGTVCAQWWTGDNEMAVVDPFNNRVFTVPTLTDLKCNARELVSKSIDLDAAKPLDLSLMWVDHDRNEVGFYRDDFPENICPYTARLSGMSLLALKEDEDGNMVVLKTSALARLMHYMSGNTLAFLDYKWSRVPKIIDPRLGVTDFGYKVLGWAATMSPEHKEILSK